MRWLAGRDDDDGGAVGILTAATLAVLFAFGAIAADASYLYFGKRDLQAAVDAAALSAARNPADAEALARETLRVQGLESIPAPDVSIGTYDAGAAPESRFTATGDAAAANAVKVVAQRDLPLMLGRLFLPAGQSRIGAQAVAMHVPAGAFMLSSTTAALNGGLLNQTLSALLGGKVELSLASYRGLADADVSLLRMLDFLAIDLGLEAGTYDGLLDLDVTAGQLLNAAAQVLDTAADAPAATARSALAVLARVNPSLTLKLRQLLDLGILRQEQTGAGLNGSAYADVALDALQLVQATALVGGSNSVVDLGAGVNLSALGQTLASVRARLLAIQPPVTAPAPPTEGAVVLGPVGSVAKTAQLRLLLDVRLLSLSLPLLGTLTDIHLPVFLQVSPARAELTEISCPANNLPEDDTTMTIATETGVLTAQIGAVSEAALTTSEMVPQIQPATLVNLLGIRITAQTRQPVRVGDAAPQSHRFSAAEVAAREPWSTSATKPVGSLLSSLGGSNLDLRVSLPLGIILPVTALTGPILSLVAELLSPLDVLVDDLLAALGLRLGIAEVTPLGVRCGVPVLVM